jgi:hypothetical protein
MMMMLMMRMRMMMEMMMMMMMMMMIDTDNDNDNDVNDVDNIINSINGYSFNWNKKGQELLNKSINENEVGLIAQEVQSVIPSAISSNNNDGYLTLKYNKIIPYLVEGFKLLNDKYNKQQEQINKLLENK